LRDIKIGPQGEMGAHRDRAPVHRDAVCVRRNGGCDELIGLDRAGLELGMIELNRQSVLNREVVQLLGQDEAAEQRCPGSADARSYTVEAPACPGQIALDQITNAVSSASTSAQGL